MGFDHAWQFSYLASYLYNDILLLGYVECKLPGAVIDILCMILFEQANLLAYLTS